MRPLLVCLAALTAACTPPPVDVTEDTPDEPCARPDYQDLPDVRCSGDIARLTNTLHTDVTLVHDLTWLLVGGVFFGEPGEGLTMTIEPGTTIYGETATDGFLVIQPGNKILADGTAAEPIVFTSPQDVGSRARSDWGGLIINGNAPTNVCREPADCPAHGEASTGVYGGQDPDDDSGILRYVRVEFAGTLVNDKQEINGIALQGVGRGTTIDYIHTHRSSDDGIEMFGGTVDLKHVLSTGAGDDGFDWTDGWSGRAQFVLVQHHPDAGDNGIEADNNKDAFDLTPRSEPKLRNVTLLKARAEKAFSNGYGMLLRAGTAGHIRQVVVSDYEFGCASIDDATTFDVGMECNTSTPTGALEVEYAWFNCANTVRPGEPFPADDFDFNSDQAQCDVDAFFRTGNVGNTVSDESGLRAPFDVVHPDFRPTDGSPLVAVTVPADADPWFESTDYLGAMGTEDWTSWTEFPEN